jgi:CheY-like chemotaxis protein
VILVAEDDPDIRQCAVQICRDLGATVFEPAEAVQALALLHPEIGILFSDLRCCPGCI